MASARQVKQRINVARNISKITKAMEMVSASKMRKAQERALAARAYARAISHFLQMLDKIEDDSLHPLLKANSVGKPIALLIATDRGLCGSLNQSLFKELIRWQKAHPYGEVIAIGKKAVHFCQYYGLSLYAQFNDLPDQITSSDIAPVSRILIDGYLASQFQSVTLFFSDFINTLAQQATAQPLLPLHAEGLKQDQALAEVNHHLEYLFEPSPAAILNHLLPFYVENSLYQAFLESRASEHSARMVTMKNASDNAKDVVAGLQLVFNKQRQASITSELLDITTATVSLQE